MGSAMLGVISWWVVGTSGLRMYGKSMFALSSMVSSNATAAKARFGMFPTDMPNLHGLTFGLSRGAQWGALLNFFLCCVVLYYAWHYGRSLMVAIPAAMLVSYHMQPHDLVLLLLPLTIALEEQLTGRGIMAIEGPFRVPPLYWMSLCVSFLVLPLAAVLMAYGLGFLVSIAVAGVMVHSLRFQRFSKAEINQVRLAA